MRPSQVGSRETDRLSLAAAIDAGGPARRSAIDRLDKVCRGRQAIVLNNPELDTIVIELSEIFAREHPKDRDKWVPMLRPNPWPPSGNTAFRRAAISAPHHGDLPQPGATLRFKTGWDR